MWDFVSDQQVQKSQAPLQVARCTKIIKGDLTEAAENQNLGAPNASLTNEVNNVVEPVGEAQEDDYKYMITIKQIAKFVVGLGKKISPTDVEEGMRVGVDRTKYSIEIPLRPKIDPSVTAMQVEDKPDVTYEDIGGAKDSLEKVIWFLSSGILLYDIFHY